jgi:hypothetical protein
MVHGVADTARDPLHGDVASSFFKIPVEVVELQNEIEVFDMRARCSLGVLRRGTAALHQRGASVKRTFGLPFDKIRL